MTPNEPKGKGVALIIGVGKPHGEPPPLGPPGKEPDLDDQPDSCTETCSTCHYFRDDDGRCARFPPHGPEWSTVDPGDWCGEFAAGSQHKYATDEAATQQDPGMAMNGSPRAQMPPMR